MSAARHDGFTVLPAIFTGEEIASLRRAGADRPTRGLQGRWPVVMWVKAGGRPSPC